LNVISKLETHNDYKAIGFGGGVIGFISTGVIIYPNRLAKKDSGMLEFRTCRFLSVFSLREVTGL
jgi:hypothetical protein